MAKVAFTAGRVAGFKCPTDKRQAFMWDSTTLGLGLRATPSGKPAYVFQGVYQGDTVRITIGSPTAWSIPDAQAKARELQRLIDEGKDPRDLKREAVAAHLEKQAAAVAQAVTVGDLWPTYLVEGRPKRKDAFKPRYLTDLHRMAAPGGEPKQRGQGLTRPGPIFPLLALSLSSITEDALKEWHDQEARAGKHQAARALMMFRGFMRWAAAQKKYRALVDLSAGKAPAILDTLPSTIESRRTDALEAAQVRGWWEGVTQLPNPTASTYLRALLLTGARREELAALKWDDIDFRWRKLTIADKVGETRTIPLSPYLGQLLASLPRKKGDDGHLMPHVFASTGKTGRITDARASHAKALQGAGIEHLTFHGLRRSFALLGEAAGAPAGAIAQVMGHRPSATAEGYKPRSVDALRPYLERIEEHILDLAEVQFDRAAEPGRLRVVAA